MASFIVFGWICSFLFNVVVNAASGEADLPELTATEGVVDDVIVPVIKFVATWAIVMAPALVYLLVVTLMELPGAGDEGDPILLVLVGLGVFTWPIAMLVVALGGLSSFLRPDLIVRTLGRTLVPYLSACALTAAALAAFWSAREGVLRTGGGVASHPLLVAMFLEVVQLYAWVVAGRVIGAYYHHFKHRFAWSWG